MKFFRVNYKYILIAIAVFLLCIAFFTEKHTIQNAKIIINSDEFSNNDVFKTPLAVAIKSIKGVGSMSASSNGEYGYYSISIDNSFKVEDVLKEVENEIKSIKPMLSDGRKVVPIVEKNPYKEYRVFGVSYSSVERVFGLVIGVVFIVIPLAFVYAIAKITVFPIMYVYEYIYYLYPLLIIFLLIFVMLIVGLNTFRESSVKFITLKLVASYLLASFISINYAVYLCENHIRSIANNKYNTEPLSMNISVDTYFFGSSSHHAIIELDGEYKHWSFSNNDFVD